MNPLRVVYLLIFPLVLILATAGAQIEESSGGDPATIAFENGQWALAVDLYEEHLVDDPDNGTTWLRIAQAQRGLGEHELALETLERALGRAGPEAMINLERARNLVSLDQPLLALGALEAADHLGLRALSSLEEAEEFAPLRREQRFQGIYSNVRSRIYPCEGIAASNSFDFWLGNWEVRLVDGTLVGRSEVRKQAGGCSVAEDWTGTGGSEGSSINYYMPSRDQWRQIWVGSGGALIDMAGGPDAGGIRLEGTIEYVEQEEVLAFRGTWEPLLDGGVRQHFEEFNLVAQGWNTWFEGYYRLIADP